MSKQLLNYSLTPIYLFYSLTPIYLFYSLTPIYLDFKKFRVDQRRIEVLRSLKERCMVLKPDKGQGIVVVNKKYYYDSLEPIIY